MGLWWSTSRPSSIPEPPPTFDEPWRNVNWGQNEDLLWNLVEFKPSSKVQHLRILLHGPVGAGKSSFINSVSTAIQRRSTCNAPVDSQGGHSFTLEYKMYKIKNGAGSFFPFVFNDTMGLEEECSQGVSAKDIGKALKGHVKDMYTFNPAKELTSDCDKYNSTPCLSDKVHCLVSVIPGDKISIMTNGVISKLRDIRLKARDLGIPQVSIMTMVDKACPLVSKDLKKIYKSKKIKENMEECSNMLGVSMNYIYPMKNYSHEIENNPDMDILILTAVKNILNFASDYVENL